MHSCISSSLIPTLLSTSLISSLSPSPAHHASPQPAEIVLGTGMSRPGTAFALHAFSMAIASVVHKTILTEETLSAEGLHIDCDSISNRHGLHL